MKKIKCDCGLQAAVRSSWTHENPVRKFIACKLYNHDTRGCEFFDWVSDDPLEWQRDITNTLVAEKHILATDLSLLRGRVALIEHEKKRLTDELQKMKRKFEKKVGCSSESQQHNKIGSLST